MFKKKKKRKTFINLYVGKEEGRSIEVKMLVIYIFFYQETDKKKNYINLYAGKEEGRSIEVKKLVI